MDIADRIVKKDGKFTKFGKLFNLSGFGAFLIEMDLDGLYLDARGYIISDRNGDPKILYGKNIRVYVRKRGIVKYEVKYVDANLIRTAVRNVFDWTLLSKKDPEDFAAYSAVFKDTRYVVPFYGNSISSMDTSRAQVVDVSRADIVARGLAASMPGVQIAILKFDQLVIAPKITISDVSVISI